MTKTSQTPIAVRRGGSMGAYSQALGPSRFALAPAIHDAHCRDDRAEMVGRFMVARGRGPVAVVLGRCLGLPRPGSDVPLRLRIERSRGCETWLREFGDHKGLRTTQRAVSAGRIEERVGPVAILLDVRADGGALCLRQVSAAIAVCGLRIRVPAWLCPRTTASVTPTAEGGMTVEVRATLPRGRLLVAYSGTVQAVGA